MLNLSKLSFIRIFAADYPHMPIGKVWIYQLLFVFFACTVTDFSDDDKSSGVTFCSAFLRRPSQRITHFGELCSPKSPKSDESASVRATPTPM